MTTHYTGKEIDRPLGLDGAVRRRRGLRLSVAPGQVLFGLIGLAILASSTAVALREQPFRTPQPVAVSKPGTEPAGIETAADIRGYPKASDASGPSIIHVDPPAQEEDGGNVVVIHDPTALTQNPRLAHLPDRSLIEESPFGPLPTRAADGRRPFDVYARPWSGARGARVAIIIGGLGVSQTGTQGAIAALPPEVTLAFASSGNSLDRWMQAARRKGHEIVLQLPLEPFDYPNVDPGRDTLTVDAEATENRDRLYRLLSRITNYTGVINYMGARFVADRAAMEPFLGELGERGLMYVDDGSAARSLAPGLAVKNRVPFAAGDMIIDADRSRSDVLNRLDELERTARAQGSAVGIGSAFDVTVDAVADWAAEARRRGIEIVPISAVANDPED